MSPERPFGDSGTEHRTKHDHPRPTEEATTAVSTPNHFWRMMTDPGFPSPASNPASLMVTAEAFLGLTSQVQALAGMMQTVIPYLPQLVHSMAHQSAPPTAPPQMESPMAPDRGIPPDVEPPQPRIAEVRPASSTPMPARSQSRSYNPAPTELDLDTLSTDSTDSLREESPTSIHPWLRLSRFFWSLIEGPPTTLPKMLQRAHQYMATKTLIAGKRDETKRSRGEHPRGHLAPPPKRREDRSGLLPARPPLIPLNSTRMEIFFQIREKGLLKALSPMKSHPERRDKRMYCRFHREYGHDTEECCDLQYQIEDLIRRGHLRRYVREQPSLPDDRPSRDLSPRPQGPIEKQINVIFGGPASGDNSSSTRRAYA
ncbi:hypothetical protein B296_00029668 [Ensete ventricosum]|uniref:Retrotransposon gag domain-containing protein n=1 Tax=Ensete ventricosum TaxID=4639 RepID=A0A426XKY4_ENSVE|nr:hypothetical protein B296_00029668 [Ensete ventricosum]